MGLGLNRPKMVAQGKPGSDGPSAFPEYVAASTPIPSGSFPGYVPPGQGGASSSAFPGTNPNASTFSAQLDPGIASAMDMAKSRVNSPYEVDPYLQKQLSEDNTQSLITRATGNIRDNAAGAAARAEALAAKDMGPGANQRALQEDASRKAAAASTDITNARAAAKDALASTEAGIRNADIQGKNALVGTFSGAASAGAGNQLAQIAQQQEATRQSWAQLQDLLQLKMFSGAAGGIPGVVGGGSYMPVGAGGSALSWA